MSELPVTPPEEAIREARRHPNGWVYQIAGRYGPSDDVPPEAIVGAWRVDADGNIVGEFIPNPNYRPASGEGGRRPDNLGGTAPQP
jgi:hypothetical protein